ncbi:NTPase [Pyrobaculum sp. 3827-6]|uniref:NTPase n=1 Tax=Pyrobaculum sp. 3827-6 TaxID=2983604 RepID=UPI0021DAAA0C|nr:NTPase [Pyrobaculum sp. 3827-6]MCU7787213.1 NTPase [Pyrobaculum sp. 3827-6]
MTWRERAEGRIGISGLPGVGKTTLALKVAELAKQKLSVCGFVTIEVREGGSRIGFDVVELVGGSRTPLARVGSGEPSVGRYVVRLEACQAIRSALSQRCELKIIDEIGAMEFKCPGFGEYLQNALYNTPRVLATIHRNYIEMAKRFGFEVFWLTRENWNHVFQQVVARLGLS